MHGLVVRRALGEEVPLRAGVQNPQHRLQDGSRRDRQASGAAFG
jgi:hypothetical protein